MKRRLIRASLASCLLGLGLGLVGCAGSPSDTAPIVPAKDGAPVPLAGADSPSEAYAVAGALPPAQFPAVLAAFNGALKGTLGETSGIWRLQPERDRPTRVVLDAERAFETGSAQLRPELLLPLSEIAKAARGGNANAGPWVIHVIGHVERAEDASLSERRATAIASYLAEQDVPGGRLRAETRSEKNGAGHRIELVFAAIVEGRESRAWMPPGTIAASR